MTKTRSRPGTVFLLALACALLSLLSLGSVLGRTVSASGDPDPAVLDFAVFGAGDGANGNTTSMGRDVTVVGGMVGGNRKIQVRGGSNVTGIRSGWDTYVGHEVGGEGDDEDGELDEEGALGLTRGIIANGKVTLTRKSTILGNVDGTGDLRVGVQATVQGYARAGELDMNQQGKIGGNADTQKATIGKNAVITGTLTLPVGVAPTGAGISSGTASIGALANGSPAAPATFTKLQLPAAQSYSAGNTAAQDRSVAKNGALTLPPGTYRDVELKQGATLNLSAGAYVVRKFKTAADSTININVTGGDVTILAAGDIDFGQDLDVNVAGGDAENVYWETAGTFRTSADSTFFGTVLSTKSNSPGQKGITVGTKNTVTGALYSKEQVRVARGSTIIYNVARFFSDQFDSTPPSITPVITGALGSNGWYISPTVGVTWTVTDAESPVTSTTGCGPTTITADGATTLTCSATSAGGTASASVTIKHDATAPVVTATPDRAPDHNGWYNHALTITFAGTDATSGIDACAPALVYSGPDNASASVSGACTDVAGNSASAPLDFQYDATAPTITGAGVPPPNGEGWNNTAVTISFTCADATSGVAACTAPVTVSGEGANQQVHGTVADNAGNSSFFDVFVNIDLTNPTATIARPVEGEVILIGTAAAADYICADTLSGLQSCIGTVADGANIDTDTAGPKTFTVTATDKAGNSFVKTVNYTITNIITFNQPLADTFIRGGAQNQNEGLNPGLRIQASGSNRILLSFDLAGINTARVVKATLKMTAFKNDGTLPGPNFSTSSWGTEGRDINAYPLTTYWVEGNGLDGDLPGSMDSRGTGHGATFNCFDDPDISNGNDDDCVDWGGTDGAHAADPDFFLPATGDPVRIVNDFYGEIEFDVTIDVQNGTAGNGWVVRKTEDGAGQIHFYSKEGSTLYMAAVPPQLVLELE